MAENTEKVEKLDFHSYRKRKSADRKKYRKKWFKTTKFGIMLDHAFYKDVQVDLSPEQDGSLVKTIRKPRITKRILIFVTLAVVIVLSFLPFNYEKDVRINWVAFGNNFKRLGRLVEIRMGELCNRYSDSSDQLTSFLTDFLYQLQGYCLRCCDCYPGLLSLRQ